MSHAQTAPRLAAYACIAACAALFASCATQSSTAPRVSPSFDYTPPEEAAPGSTDITFAVVGAEFETPVQTFNPMASIREVPMFREFAGNMRSDFAEIVTARGYTMRGPFETYDQMTFPDKENSNLVLSARVSFIQDLTGMHQKLNDGYFYGGDYYTVEGSIVVRPRVEIGLWESLTGERMWTKSVDITPITVTITSSIGYRTPVTLHDILVNDNQFYSDLGRQLEIQYQEIMNRTYGYLDPGEMELVNRQATSLRERKTY